MVENAFVINSEPVSERAIMCQFAYYDWRNFACVFAVHAHCFLLPQSVNCGCWLITINIVTLTPVIPNHFFFSFCCWVRVLIHLCYGSCIWYCLISNSSKSLSHPTTDNLFCLFSRIVFWGFKVDLHLINFVIWILSFRLTFLTFEKEKNIVRSEKIQLLWTYKYCSDKN